MLQESWHPFDSCSSSQFHTGLQRHKEEEAARRAAEREEAAAAAPGSGPGPSEGALDCAAEAGASGAAVPASSLDRSWEQELVERIDMRVPGEETQAVWAYLVFLDNASPLSPRPARFNSAETREQARDEGAALLRRACFAHGVPQYNEARLLRYTECAHFWCKLYLLCPFMSQVWSTFQADPANDNCAAARPSQEQQRAADRARIQRIPNFHPKRENRAYFGLWYGCLAHMESLIALFFI